MKFTVTDKDKKLLILVSCALIVIVCMQYLILPELSRKQELEISLEELELQKTQWEFQIKKLSFLDTTTAQRRTQLADLKKPFYPVIETREMDKIITNLVMQHKLFPKSLVLKAGFPEFLPDYFYYSPPTERESIPKGYVLVGKASLEVEGNTVQWLELMDDVIDNYSGLRITGFDVLDVQYIDANGQNVTTHSIKADMDIYMCTE